MKSTIFLVIVFCFVCLMDFVSANLEERWKVYIINRKEDPLTKMPQEQNWPSYDQVLAHPPSPQIEEITREEAASLNLGDYSNKFLQDKIPHLELHRQQNNFQRNQPFLHPVLQPYHVQQNAHRYNFQHAIGPYNVQQGEQPYNIQQVQPSNVQQLEYINNVQQPISSNAYIGEDERLDTLMQEKVSQDQRINYHKNDGDEEGRSDILQMHENPLEFKHHLEHKNFHNHVEPNDLQNNTVLNYNQINVHQNYAPPTNNRIYARPTNNQNYVPPVNNQNYAPLANSQNYVPNANNQNYAPPSNNQNYIPPTNYQHYVPPSNMQQEQQPNKVLGDPYNDSLKLWNQGTTDVHDPTVRTRPPTLNNGSAGKLVLWITNSAGVSTQDYAYYGKNLATSPKHVF